MKVLFVHGHKFRRINGVFYSPGGLPEDVLNRYVDLYGSIHVVSRVIEEESPKQNYVPIKNSNITISNSAHLEQQVKNYDAVIIRLPSVDGYKAVHYAKKYGKPYLIEVVGCIWDAYWNYSVKGKLVALPAMLIMKHSVKSAPYVVYVSQEFLQKRYPTVGRAVGISDVSILPKDDKILEERKRHIEKMENHIVIGTTAAINVPYKGQEYMIRAIPQIERQLGCPVEYQLVGGGDKAGLAQIAESCGVAEKVKFIGIMDHDAVFNWLDKIDIYVQPSLQEGLCRALVEAMSRGLPCLASKVGGNPELLDSECIFSMKNKKKIPERIARLVCKMYDHQFLLEQAELNFNNAYDTFEVNKLNQQRIEFYSLLKEEMNNV